MKILIISLFLLTFIPRGSAQTLGFPGPGVKSYAGGGSISLDQHNGTSCAAECASDANSSTYNPTAGSRVGLFVFWCADSSCATTPLTGDITSVGNGGSDTFTTATFCQGTVTNTGFKVGRKLFTVSSAAGGSTTLTVQFGAGLAWYVEAHWASVVNSSGMDSNGQLCTTGTSPDPVLTSPGNLASTNSLIMTDIWVQGTVTVNNPSGNTSIYTSGSNPNVRGAYVVGGTSGSPFSVTYGTASVNTDYTGGMLTFKP